MWIQTCSTYPGPNRGFPGMSEQKHTELFGRNGYTWPPTKPTAGWPPREADEHSEKFRETRNQIEAWIRRDVVGDDNKFNEFGALAQSYIMPSFTRYMLPILNP